MVVEDGSGLGDGAQQRLALLRRLRHRSSIGEAFDIALHLMSLTSCSHLLGPLHLLVQKVLLLGSHLLTAELGGMNLSFQSLRCLTRSRRLLLLLRCHNCTR